VRQYEQVNKQFRSTLSAVGHEELALQLRIMRSQLGAASEDLAARYGPGHRSAKATQKAIASVDRLTAILREQWGDESHRFGALYSRPYGQNSRRLHGATNRNADEYGGLKKYDKSS
jgi:hypothetical protein